jgi:hypothetical protein
MDEQFLFARARVVHDRRIAHHLDAVDDTDEAASSHEDECVDVDGFGCAGVGGRLPARDGPKRDTISIEDGLQAEHGRFVEK